MMIKNDGSGGNDFVDYFFQKDGDTFIAKLIKLREDFTKECSQILSTANSSTKKSYSEFRDKLLDPAKITPVISNVENFDFDEELKSVFTDLNMDVQNSLEMIAKYYGFIANLHEHWKKLEVDSVTVIDTSVQLMATLESMVYPLFLALTEYIGNLGMGNQEKAGDSTSPEMLMMRLHKLSGSLTKEIGAIGASAVVTLGKRANVCQESLRGDSCCLGIQGKNAKNCISWAMQAVAPALLFYYLQSVDGRGTGTGIGADGAGAAFVSCTCKPKQITETTVEVTKKKDVQSQAKPDQFVTTATTKVQVEKEEDEENEDEEEESESESATTEASETSIQKVPSKKAVKVDTDNFVSVTSENVERTDNDFVSYFFKKNGIKYVAILAQTRKKYEDRCRTILNATKSEDRQKAKAFMAVVQDVRKIAPVTKEITVGDFNFPDEFAGALEGLDVDSGDKLAMLRKYQEYVRGMVRHWRYRIENNKDLSADTVVDVGTQMMATTMALTYPIFIRIGEFLRKLGKSADAAKTKYTPDGLAGQLHKLAEINALQMAAIGLSCLNIIAKLQDTTKDIMRQKRDAISGQTTLAKNSVTWAMKAISPLLLLYFIRAKLQISVQMTPEVAVQEKKARKVEVQPRQKSPVNQSRPQSANANANTPYQDALHMKNAAEKYYKKPAEQNSFVHYFYGKQGQHFSTILMRMLKEYETVVQDAMKTAPPSVKDKAVNFINEYHNARKPSIPQGDMEVADIKFADAVGQIFKGIKIDIGDNLNTLIKYFEFTKNMEAHWQYRISKGLELNQDAVIEVSVEMMGTTVALAYPIFIKMAEYVIDMMKRDEVKSVPYSPKNIVDRFKRFVTLLTTEMAAIGMSCTTTMAKIPNVTKQSVSIRTTRLADETKLADTAVSWAMKAIFPVFMLFFIQYESAQ